MTVLGRMTYRPQPEAKLVQKGVHVIMLMRPLNWWGWEVVFVTGTLNSLLELEYRGSWMKLHVQKGNKNLPVLYK